MTQTRTRLTRAQAQAQAQKKNNEDERVKYDQERMCEWREGRFECLMLRFGSCFDGGWRMEDD